MSREALEGGVSQINSRYIRFNDGHGSPNVLGVLLCAEVQPLNDGEHALVAVIGVYEDDGDCSVYRVGEVNTESEKFKPYLEKAAEQIQRRTSQCVSDSIRAATDSPRNIADLLETYLDSTAIWSDGSVYKVKHFIASVGNLEIHVYRDHNPPHFHVKSKQRNIDASFHLDTLEPLKGKAGAISGSDIKKIKNFFSDPAMMQMLKKEHARMQS